MSSSELFAAYGGRETNFPPLGTLSMMVVPIIMFLRFFFVEITINRMAAGQKRGHEWRKSTEQWVGCQFLVGELFQVQW